jgi:hypothetical protein
MTFFGRKDDEREPRAEDHASSVAVAPHTHPCRANRPQPCFDRRASRKAIMRRLLLLFVLLLPAAAVAEPVFVPGGRIGLEPPNGFVPSNRFGGFEHPRSGATIVLTELPRDAWGKMRGSMTDTALKAQNITVEKRETVTVDGSDALLLHGKQEASGLMADKWILVVGYPTVTGLVTYQVSEMAVDPSPPEDIRKALLSTVFRPPVSIAEQVSDLPFTIGALDGFRVERVLPGNTAIIIEDGARGGSGPQPMFVASAAADGAPPAALRDEFARQAIAGFGLVSDVTVEASKPVELDGDPGSELTAQAIDRRTGEQVALVQWMRFRDEGYLRYLGIAPIAERERLLARYRQVRDAIDPRPMP